MGKEHSLARYSVDGVSAIKAFKLFDSQGKTVETCEDQLLSRVLWGKKWINTQIAMWVDGIRDGIITLNECKLGHEWFPGWVWSAVMGQLSPEHQRHERVCGMVQRCWLENREPLICQK